MFFAKLVIFNALCKVAENAFSLTQGILSLLLGSPNNVVDSNFGIRHSFVRRLL